jgi:hypothetical protein
MGAVNDLFFTWFYGIGIKPQAQQDQLRADVNAIWAKLRAFIQAKQVLPRLQHFRTLLGRRPAASLAPAPTPTPTPTIRYSTVQLYDECLSANASLPKAGDIIARAKAPVVLTADGVVSTGNFSCQDIGRCTRVTTDGNGR